MNIKKWILIVTLLLLITALASCDMGLPSEREAAAPTQSPRMEMLASGETSAGGFTVSRAFTSNMVIQRDEPIRVWGWAGESRNGETVTATFAGQSAEGKIENGEWLVTFAEGFAASAAMGNDMIVTCGADKVVLEDVLVGDVYMVIGQSNVAYWLETHCAANGVDYYALINGTKSLRLRYNSLGDTAGYPKQGTEEVCLDVLNGRPWWIPDAQNARQFTAIGYLFALEIIERTNGEIPVGIIEIDGNGQPIGAFMPNEAAGATDSDSYAADVGYFVTPGVNGNHARYMYNHHMYPYERYALAGVVWYQGESDFQKENADTYVDKFTALMEHMRSTHNLKNKDFPVYIVEFPTIYHQPADFTGGGFATMDLGYIRAEMGSIPQRLSNSYLAVSSDIFADDHYWNSLHPDIKGPQAKRLADIAGSVWYGLSPLDEATGPILKDYAISEDRLTITLTFDNVAEGLSTADGGKTVNGFVAINRVGTLSPGHKITATITGKDQITVASSKPMYGVAYNCVMDNFYGKQINLCNSNGRIASAFTFAEMRMYRIRHEIIGEGAELVTPAAEDVYAIHFRALSDLVSVGTQLYKNNTVGGQVTLSVYAFQTDYATTMASKPLVTETCKNFDKFEWVELTAGRTKLWDEGEYLLVIAGIEDAMIRTGTAHEGQFCYKNGAYLPDASILLALTYDCRVEKAYGIPTDENAETETETQGETTPETLPESHSEDTLPETKVEESIPADTATVSESDSAASAETDAGDAEGCASAYGALAVIGMLTLAACALLRRREEAGK